MGEEVEPMTVTTRYEHIVVDESHVALIDGTTMKVIELVFVRDIQHLLPTPSLVAKLKAQGLV